MKYIKTFKESIETAINDDSKTVLNQNVETSIINTIYDERWKEELSEYFIINYHGKLYKFKKDNIMLHSDMIQITYSSVPGDVKTSTEPGEIWGAPDTLEFDLYFAKNTNNKITINISITYGDYVVCEFSVESPNNIKVFQYTSHHSKFDRSNTIFGLDDDSLNSFIKFLNKFDGMKLTTDDFKFLDQYDDYKPKSFPKDAHIINKVNKTGNGYPNDISNEK
jgi:hypothetical protein